jgi:hypothetical protein
MKKSIAWDAIISSIDMGLFPIVRLVEVIKKNTPKLNVVKLLWVELEKSSNIRLISH